MHHGSPATTSDDRGFWANRPGFKPVILLIAAVVFVGLVLLPPPQGMIDLVKRCAASRSRPDGSQELLDLSFREDSIRSFHVVPTTGTKHSKSM